MSASAWTEAGRQRRRLGEAAVPVGREAFAGSGRAYGSALLESKCALNGVGVVANNPRQSGCFQHLGRRHSTKPSAVGNGFEAFGFVPCYSSETWLNLGDDRYKLQRAYGLLVGAGVRVVSGWISCHHQTASLFVDYTIHHANLTDTGAGR